MLLRALCPPRLIGAVISEKCIKSCLVLFFAVIALLAISCPAMAQTLPSPSVLQPAPSPVQRVEPSLVDKLLNLLSTEKMPHIDIPPPPAEHMADPSQTVSAPPPSSGLEIGQNFMPIYSLDKGAQDDETPPILPFFSTAPLNEPHKGVQMLVIMLHDHTREAARAFAYARSAQEEAMARHPEWNADASFIFAPQFLSTEDVAAHAQSWPDGGTSLLRWVGDNWAIGMDSVTAESNGIWQPKNGSNVKLSSFTVMDFMLLLLARPKLFPDLQKVVIAGTAGGGDFVQRYAALGIAPMILGEEGIDVRFVPAQTRSFLYLDNQRLVPKRDDPLSTKIESEAFAPTRLDACKSMNSYPYGLDNVIPYGRKNAVNEVRLNYSTRRVIYLTGAGATLPVVETTPDACALTAQGGTIRKRSEIFFASLKRLYGEDASRMQKLYLVQNINEDGLSLWRSACGGTALFGDGACNPDDVGSKAMQIIK